MRNAGIGILILILSSCSSNVSSDISKADFITQLDEECAKSLKDMNSLIAQSKKVNQSPAASAALYEGMTHQLTRLSHNMKDIAAPAEDAVLLNQFFQEDRNVREMLIKLEEISSAFAKVSIKSQTSPEQAALLKEISTAEDHLKNDISAQSGKRASIAVRYGFETCGSIDPSVAWAQRGN